ncbi:hypothetical protein HOY80DRAFT_981940 [Tuber brumale]|nr:hypothetical protein HOY80DRAFT_981940 [Tuber brumale]
MEGSIIDKTETNHAFSFLDCFAKIAVSQKRSEAVAIALQLLPQAREIHCTIAGTKGVREDLVEHLTKVSGMLQALSMEYGRSSVESAGHVHAIKLRIFREIYEFSIEKLMKLKGKWWNDLRVFMVQLCECRGGDDLQEGVKMNLFHAVAEFGQAFRLRGKLHNKEANPPTGSEWETIRRHIIQAYSNARLLLADDRKSHCENLAKKFSDHFRGGLTHLRRTIEKLIFPVCHVECLVACSVPNRPGRPTGPWRTVVPGIPGRVGEDSRAWHLPLIKTAVLGVDTQALES